jgi:hypothetical protein
MELFAHDVSHQISRHGRIRPRHHLKPLIIVLLLLLVVIVSVGDSRYKKWFFVVLIGYDRGT